MISVTPNARNREDRAGDPLDGLVNLFDLGSCCRSRSCSRRCPRFTWRGTITSHGLRATAPSRSTSSRGRRSRRCPSPARGRSARARRSGVVYRLANGQLVYVQQAPAAQQH